MKHLKFSTRMSGRGAPSIYLHYKGMIKLNPAGAALLKVKAGSDSLVIAENPIEGGRLSFYVAKGKDGDGYALQRTDTQFSSVALVKYLADKMKRQLDKDTRNIRLDIATSPIEKEGYRYHLIH